MLRQAFGNFVSSHGDVLRGSSRVPTPRTSGAGTRDEPLRTSSWEASNFAHFCTFFAAMYLNETQEKNLRL